MAITVGRPMRLALVSIALPLAACAPDLGPMPEAKALSSFEMSQSFAAPQAAWPEEEWWKAYGDPQLDALIAEAIADSPDLKMAAARVRGMAAMEDVAGADLWPTVNGEAALQETHPSRNQGFPYPYNALLPKGWHTSASLAAQLDYELDFFGKNRAALAAATSEAEAAKAEQAEARLAISAGVATTYATLNGLFTDQSLAHDAVRIRETDLSLVQSRYSRGLENRGQLSQAKAQLESAKTQAAVYDRLVLLARHQLAALLGKGPDRGLSIQPTLRAALKAPGLPSSLSVDLIGRRPDIIAARLNVEAASSRVDVANANFYPNVDLVAAFGVEGLDAKDLFSGTSAVGKLGPAITLPIFHYGRITGAYRGARAQYDAAVANYDKTVANALKDVADAYGSRRGVEAELVHAHAGLQEAENSYDVLSRRYKAGITPYTDLLNAESELIEARRVTADLESEAFADDIALARALGGGYSASK
ncbi:MAG: efflux transporter outer membrane subunit [Alphaproteobacteria bacterium]|nr:efflux transporter outer membrane subunit [Alphaproteobacteria bacterium]